VEMMAVNGGGESGEN